MRISPAKNLIGAVRLPGDKSISHRAAMFAALARGTSRIENFATSADCASTLNCLRTLGVRIEQAGTTVTIHGVGKRGLAAPEKPLDCGNSGTTMRLMSGILAGQNFDSVLIGDESLSKRPMKRVIEPLRRMGAVIESVDGHAPLTIRGKNPLTAIEYETVIASAQVKSAVLLAGLNADGVTSVVENTPTRNHTELMLKMFGVNVGPNISVSGAAVITALDFRVPGDISSAAFFIVAAACLEGSRIVIENVGLNPSRSAILGTLVSFGVDVQVSDLRDTDSEPVATITIQGCNSLIRKGESNILNGKIIANMIDEIPILAVFGTQIEGGIEIRDAGELRVKESDRIVSVVENLKRMGADVAEFDDGLRVGKSNLKGAVIDSFGDHRIAMAFAVAALFADGETEINSAECADVSFPGFFDVLQSVRT